MFASASDSSRSGPPLLRTLMTRPLRFTKRTTAPEHADDPSAAAKSVPLLAPGTLDW